jgi:hypothetical protein
VRRRHPDVGQHQGRLTFADHVEQLDRIARLPDDLEPGSLQEAGQPLTEQDVVIGDDHAHGTHRGDSPIPCSPVQAAPPALPKW